MIQVHVDNAPNFAGVRFWIIDRHGVDGKIYQIRFGKHHTTLELIGEDSGAFELPPPTFTLAGDVAHQFMKQMAELALARGIKLESDLKLEGRLAAVEAHLADMRRLVFHDEMKGAEAMVESVAAEVRALREEVLPTIR